MHFLVYLGVDVCDRGVKIQSLAIGFQEKVGPAQLVIPLYQASIIIKNLIYQVNELALLFA